VDAAEMERRAQHMREQREALIAKKKAARNEKVILQPVWSTFVQFVECSDIYGHRNFAPFTCAFTFPH